LWAYAGCVVVCDVGSEAGAARHADIGRGTGHAVGDGACCAVLVRIVRAGRADRKAGGLHSRPKDIAVSDISELVAVVGELEGGRVGVRQVPVEVHLDHSHEAVSSIFGLAEVSIRHAHVVDEELVEVVTVLGVVAVDGSSGSVEHIINQQNSGLNSCEVKCVSSAIYGNFIGEVIRGRIGVSVAVTVVVYPGFVARAVLAGHPLHEVHHVRRASVVVEVEFG
jgi:hypothetical protein